MSVLECKQLSKHFGATQALDDVSFAIEPGRIVGLLGPNGSGKTTLLKLATGLLTPTSGSVTVDGNLPGPASHAVTAFLPDRSFLPDWMSVKQALDFFQDFYPDFRRDAAEEMLANLQIPHDLRLKAMSKGTREKLQLILTMSRQARLYLLDEPIGGVDPATRDYILHTIVSSYNPEAAVLISTHLIADVEQVLDEVIFLRNGRVMLQSSVDDIRENRGMSVDALFREVFKC
ncbi:MAG: ABC transporter ATP-binding protein [Oscillospiraceae bacterium]